MISTTDTSRPIVFCYDYRLLREKNQDEEFVELCRHRRGAAQYTLESILQLPVSTHLELFTDGILGRLGPIPQITLHFSLFTPLAEKLSCIFYECLARNMYAIRFTRNIPYYYKIIQ